MTWEPRRIGVPPILIKRLVIRNWWYTYTPRSLNCSIWVKSLRAKRAVLEKKLEVLENIKSTKNCERVLKKYRIARETFLSSIVQRGKLFWQKTRNCVYAFHTTENRARLWTWVKCSITRCSRRFDDVSLSMWRGGTMASLYQRSFAEVGFGLWHGGWNDGPSRRNKRFIENHFRQIGYSSK